LALAGSLAVAVLAACSAGRSAAQAAATPATSPRPTLPPSAAGVVQVSHDLFDAHAEPHVAANPRDPRNLLAAAMVYSGADRGLATYASFDAGRNWQSNGPLPGAAPANDADVTVTFDAAGRGYVAGVVGPRGQGTPGVADVWRTNDGGRHFQARVAAIPAGADHAGVAADPTAGSADVYVAAVHFRGPAGELWFARSTDSGRSFAAPRPIDPSNSPFDRLAVLAAGTRGTVAVGYYAEPPNGAVTFNVMTSTDQGLTFGAPVVLGAVHWPARVPGLNPRSGPAIAVDPTSATIYAAAATTDSATGRSELDVFTSRDKGRSWGPPIVLAAPPGMAYLQPQLAADGRGHVGLSVFELASGRVHIALSLSTSGGTSFGPPRAITADTGFDPALGLAQGTGATAEHWIGDYEGLAATPGGFHPVWNDTRTGQLELFSATVPARRTP
jgi:hypothetical protein